MLDRKFWKKYFEVYDVLNELIPYQELTESIINHLDIKEGEKILDLGSGTGNIAIKVERKGAQVTSIDFSQEGTKLHKEKSPSSEVIVGDITERLPFADNAFDKVYSNNVLYTIPELKRKYLFSELYRVLKEGGVIVISNPVIGFKPILIYWDHIKKQVKRDGLFFALGKVLSLVIPTVKIFYYNILIKKENTSGEYQFMEKDDQRKYLEESGFKNISDNVSVYSDQAVLNQAIK